MKKNLYTNKINSVLQFAALSVMIIFMFSTMAFAQTARVVKGKVTDALTNENIPGVTVTLKGNTTAVTTNANGEYSISVSTPAVLVFTFIGYNAQQVAITSQEVVNIKLAESSEQLKDVVVTALGIKRENRTVGYAVSTIKGSELTVARTNSFANGLEGKIAGVSVSLSSTGPAASSNVNIRGIASITGNNQPLYVIDGVPMQNGNRGQTDAQGYGGGDNGDGVININPDDVETFTVLKGASASALYGFRGQNGVILITTKSGKNAKGVGIEVNSNFAIDQVQDETDFQTTYGQGYNNQKPVSQLDAFSSAVNSWGAPLDGSPTVQFDGTIRPYAAIKQSNLKNFYKNGLNATNSIAFNKSLGDDQGSIRFAVSDLHDKSIIPNAGFQQLSFTQSTNYKLAKNLELTIKASYITAYTKNVPSVSDAPGNLNFGPLFLPPNVDIRNLAPGYKADGSEQPFLDDIYTTNPYFVANKFINNIHRNRFIGSGDLKYTLDNGLYFQLRAGEDYIEDRQTNISPNGTAYAPTGSMSDQNDKASELNIDGIIGKDFKLTNDFKLTALVGGTYRHATDDVLTTAGNDFAIPYLYTVGNLKGPVQSAGSSNIQNYSIYGSFDLAYKNYLYLTLTGRNDWYSTLEPAKPTYFYPSASASFVFSELFHLENMDEGRLRVGYSNVGGEADAAYSTLLKYNIAGVSNGHPVGNISNGDSVPNSALTPSSTTELEIGTELSFFKSMLKFDVAYYNKKTSRDIIRAPTSEASGYNFVFQNSGTVRNTGIELLVEGTLVKSENFTWTESFNGSYNENTVLSLSSGATNYPISYSRYGEDDGRGINTYISQVVGKSAYQIFALDPYHKNNGEVEISKKTGAPIIARASYKDFGSGINPWSGGITSTFTYKRLTLSALIDGKFGGKIYSGTNAFAYQYGLSKETLPGRYITYGTNNTPAATYYNILSQFGEKFIYDDSFIKLRTITLGYTFPASMFHDKIQGITLSAFARNVAVLMKHTPNIDPEANYANYEQGLELASVPYTKTIGLNLSLKF